MLFVAKKGLLKHHWKWKSLMIVCSKERERNTPASVSLDVIASQEEPYVTDLLTHWLVHWLKMIYLSCLFGCVKMLCLPFEPTWSKACFGDYQFSIGWRLIRYYISRWVKVGWLNLKWLKGLNEYMSASALFSVQLYNYIHFSKSQ